MTAYKQKFVKDLLTYMSEGWLNEKIYKKFGVSEDTFYRWIREHPEFEEAYSKGYQACKAVWWEKGEKNYSMEDKGFKFWKFVMERKFNERDVPKNSEGNTTININNMNVLQTKTTQGLIDFCKSKLLKNQDQLSLSEPVEVLSEVIRDDEENGI